MIKVGERLAVLTGVLILAMFVTSGCASKKYVASQINPVNQKLAVYQKKTDDRLAWLNNKMDTNVSQLNERIATTDQNVAQVAATAQSAQGSASRAMEEVEAVKSSNAAAISGLESGVSNALNYKLTDKAEVLFGFNKSTLTPTAKATLDDMVSKFRAQPRGVLELAGFTDPIGGKNFNLELSRRRAWAVQRYLVEHQVPTRAIHVVGMGEAAPPDGLEPENSGANRAEQHRMARRVGIRLYSAGEIGSPSGSQ